MYTKFHLDWLLCESYIAICVPIVMYGLGLFIVVLQELLGLFIVVLQELQCHQSYRYLCITSPSFIALNFLVSEIVKCIACGCFTRTITIMFTVIKFFNTLCYNITSLKSKAGVSVTSTQGKLEVLRRHYEEVGKVSVDDNF